MRIRRKFLQLTRYTYPYGTESFLKTYLPKGCQKDKYGNYFYQIGEKPTTMFTCHLDTACATKQKVNHVIQNNIIKTDGKSILGADDKAGMVVLLYMIEHNIPGLYYFFIGEEVGCIGSKNLSITWSETEFSYNIFKVVSFDRRDNCSVITEQWYGRCCSDEFAEELSLRLNGAGYGLKLKPDDTGILTDSAQFMDIIPECTNISVGYKHEHTTSEYQDIDFLTRLCKSVVAINWESLPIFRDPYNFQNDVPGWDDDFFEEKSESDFSGEYYSYFQIGNDVKKMFISKKIIDYEKDLIRDWLKKTDGYADVKNFSWNGNSLYVENQYDGFSHVGNRVDLSIMISELNSVSLSNLKSKINEEFVF